MSLLPTLKGYMPDFSGFSSPAWAPLLSGARYRAAGARAFLQMHHEFDRRDMQPLQCHYELAHPARRVVQELLVVEREHIGAISVMAHVLSTQRGERRVAAPRDPTHQGTPAIVGLRAAEYRLVSELMIEVGGVHQRMSDQQHTNSIEGPMRRGEQAYTQGVTGRCTGIRCRDRARALLVAKNPHGHD